MTPKQYSPPVRPDEAENLKLFADLLQKKLLEYSERDFPEETPIGSPLRGDDKYLGGFPISLYVESQANVAIENLFSLYDLMTHEENGKPRLYLRGHGAYSIIRSAIEAAIQPMWVLIPSSRWERIERRLLIHADELTLANTAFDSFILGGNRRNRRAAKPPRIINPDLTESDLSDILASRSANTKEGIERAKELAAQTGHISEDVFNGRRKKVQLTSMLGAAEEFSPELEEMRIQAVWCFCSGLSHAKQWTHFSLQARHKIADHPNTKTSTYALSIDLTLFTQFGEVAIQVLDELLDLYDKRTTPHR